MSLILKSLNLNTRIVSLRKRLGYAKYVCLDGGHREVRYRWRLARLDRGAARSWEGLWRRGALTPIECPSRADIELHSMCGHKTAAMGLWSLWSFLRFAEGRIALHDPLRRHPQASGHCRSL